MRKIAIDAMGGYLEKYLKEARLIFEGKNFWKVLEGEKNECMGNKI